MLWTPERSALWKSAGKHVLVRQFSSCGIEGAPMKLEEDDDIEHDFTISKDRHDSSQKRQCSQTTISKIMAYMRTHVANTLILLHHAHNIIVPYHHHRSFPFQHSKGRSYPLFLVEHHS